METELLERQNLLLEKMNELLQAQSKFFVPPLLILKFLLKTLSTMKCALVFW